MGSESIAHSALASWAIDSEPMRARGIIVNYSSAEGTRGTSHNGLLTGRLRSKEVYFSGFNHIKRMEISQVEITVLKVRENYREHQLN